MFKSRATRENFRCRLAFMNRGGVGYILPFLLRSKSCNINVINRSVAHHRCLCKNIDVSDTSSIDAHPYEAMTKECCCIPARTGAGSGASLPGIAPPSLASLLSLRTNPGHILAHQTHKKCFRWNATKGYNSLYSGCASDCAQKDKQCYKLPTIHLSQLFTSL